MQLLADQSYADQHAVTPLCGEAGWELSNSSNLGDPNCPSSASAAGCGPQDLDVINAKTGVLSLCLLSEIPWTITIKCSIQCLYKLHSMGKVSLNDPSKTGMKISALLFKLPWCSCDLFVIFIHIPVGVGVLQIFQDFFFFFFATALLLPEYFSVFFLNWGCQYARMISSVFFLFHFAVCHFNRAN